MLEALAKSIGEFLQQFEPGLSEEAITDLAVRTAQEQLQVIDRTVAQTLVGEAAIQYPTLVLVLARVDDQGAGVTVKGAKALVPDMEVGLAVQTAMLLALLNAPHIRAALRVRGFKYSFAQSPEVPAGVMKPRILM
jgi:hypothetical protein